MLLLVSDANIFIDIEDGHLTPVVFRLPYEIAVPDILFELELRERHSHLLVEVWDYKPVAEKTIMAILDRADPSFDLSRGKPRPLERGQER